MFDEQNGNFYGKECSYTRDHKTVTMTADGNAYGYTHPTIDWLNMPGYKVTDKLNLVWYEDQKIGDTYIYKFQLSDVPLDYEDTEKDIKQLALSS